MIGRYLDISTGHVSNKTARWIETNPEEIISFAKQEYGWVVYAASEEPHEDIPADLLKVIEYAKKHKCVWIMFDCDGDTIDELEKFNW